MAIRISGTAVIDDSRNIVNIANANISNVFVSTSVAAPTVNAANIVYSNGGNTIRSTIYTDGTLSYETPSGDQLFGIANSANGPVFSVANTTAIPSIEVFDNGTLRIAHYSGNLAVGFGNAASNLHVFGNATIATGLVTSNVNANSFFTSTGANVFLTALNAYDQANSAYTQANNAYSTANNASNFADAAAASANAALTYRNVILAGY